MQKIIVIDTVTILKCKVYLFQYEKFWSICYSKQGYSDGLMNDLDTQPTSILLAVREKDSFIIEETEHTKPYFNGELDHLL